MPLRRVLSGPAYWDGRMGLPVPRTKLLFGTAQPINFGDWVWRVGHGANDRNSLSLDQATQSH
jgi:hypothetical protein